MKFSSNEGGKAANRHAQSTGMLDGDHPRLKQLLVFQPEERNQ
jgi:hypothetical protein